MKKETTHQKQTFEVSASATVSRNIRASNEHEAVAIFEKKHPGYKVTAVGDRELLGKCLFTNAPIFEGDNYHVDADGVMTLMK